MIYYVCGRCDRAFEKSIKVKNEDGTSNMYNYLCPHCGHEYYSTENDD